VRPRGLVDAVSDHQVGVRDGKVAVETQDGRELVADESFLTCASLIGGFIETHCHFSPRVVFVQRNKIIRMSRQAFPTTPLILGNIEVYLIGCRWYPFMFDRAGSALHQEFAMD
jgi:hypothetical protein